MTITLAAVYAPIGIQGGLTGALFREFAFTLAGAVIVSGVVALTLSPMMGSKLLKSGASERGFAGMINRHFDWVRRTYARLLTGTLHYRPVVFVLWIIVAALIVPFYLFSQKELAPKEDQSVVFGIIQAAPNATIDQTKLFASQVHDVYRSFPESESIFQITSPTGGFGGMVTKPWSARKKSTEQLQLESAAQLSKIPGVRVISLVPPALPGGGDFPVDLVIASTAEPARLTEFANKLVGKAFQSGLFMFADADLKFDQPQAEIVFDRDKLRAQGVNLSQAGRDLSTLLGGDYVNRFSIQGRSYKVIPQLKRAERLTPDQLEQVYVTGADNKLVPLSTFATLRTSTEPRELKRFQQLNAVRIQGVIPPGVSLDNALRVLEDEARRILPKGFTIDYAGESRQLRTEGGKFLGTFLLSGILIYLVLAAQFESFRDPFIILAGSVPLALSGSLLFSFLGLTTLNIFSQVGLITLVGLVSKNGILIVEFANKLQETGKEKLEAVIEAATHASQADPHDDRRDRHGPPPARLRARPGSRSAQLDRHHARQRHDHRHRVHALRRAVDLRPRRADAQGRSAGSGGQARGRGSRSRPRLAMKRQDPFNRRSPEALATGGQVGEAGPPRKLCCKASSSAPSLTGMATLPPKLLEAGVKRLGNLALLAGFISVAMAALGQIVFHQVQAPHYGGGLRVLAQAGSVVVSFAMFALTRRKGADPAGVLDRGLVYEVLYAFLIGVIFHGIPISTTFLPRGWSPVAVWIIAFPLIVPSTRGKTLVATLAAALMDPIALLVNVTVGAPLPRPLFLVQILLPTCVAAVAGIVGARIVYRLTAQAAKDREMGSYRLVSLLGRGGMGEVWRAEHQMLARPAAVKLIRPSFADGLPAAEMLARFEREAQTTAELRSPHTVQVYDFGATDDGSFYYVMELLDGFTLDTLVSRFGPQPAERVVHLLLQVCHSLAEAHQAGLVHRDIKPGNIFVCRYGLDLDFVKVLDFGLAKAVTAQASQDLTGGGFVNGTPGYMPPEMALGKKEIDGRADLYALGCVAYFLLTGETVFTANGRTPMEVLMDHAQKQPRRPSERFGRAFHPGLEALVMSCLEKDPNLRPESARELERRLRQLNLDGGWTREKAERWWAQASLPRALESEPTWTEHVSKKVEIPRRAAG